VRGRIAAHFQEVSVGLARAFGHTSADGALVTRVAPASKAENSGLRVGDIILGFGDAVSMSFTAIQQRVAASAPGTRLMLDVWRDGGALRFGADVATAETGGAATLRAPNGPHANGDGLGLALDEMRVGRTPATDAGAGLVVRDAYGIALRAGLAPGDLVLGINQRMTSTLAEYRFPHQPRSPCGRAGDAQRPSRLYRAGVSCEQRPVIPSGTSSLPPTNRGWNTAVVDSVQSRACTSASKC